MAFHRFHQLQFFRALSNVLVDIWWSEILVQRLALAGSVAQNALSPIPCEFAHRPSALELHVATQCGGSERCLCTCGTGKPLTDRQLGPGLLVGPRTDWLDSLCAVSSPWRTSGCGASSLDTLLTSATTVQDLPTVAAAARHPAKALPQETY